VSFLWGNTNQTALMCDGFSNEPLN
jgi:hypothetical protein